MKLPAKIEYACKAVLELALRHNFGEPVQLATICKSQNIPKKYLVQLFLRLKDAHIVESTRGSAGGYYLAKHPSKITLADVFKAVDSELLSPPKLSKNKHAARAENIIMHLWNELNKQFEIQLLITFDEMVAKLRGEPLTYQI